MRPHERDIVLRLTIIPDKMLSETDRNYVLGLDRQRDLELRRDQRIRLREIAEEHPRRHGNKS